MKWDDVLDDIKSTAKQSWSNHTGSLKNTWDTITDLNNISMPKIDLNNLFKTVQDITNFGQGTNLLTGDSVHVNVGHTAVQIGLNNTKTGNNSPGNQTLKTLFIEANENQGSKVTSALTQPNVNLRAVEKGLAADYTTIKDEKERKEAEAAYNAEYRNYTTVTTRMKGDKLNKYKAVNDPYSDRLAFTTPGWTYADFINERSIWQKSLQTPAGEQGWFYFKIFFNFDTQYGLLGGLLNNGSSNAAVNTAYKYLEHAGALGSYSKCNDRQVALQKFASILSYICTYAPWFFRSVKNLNQANVPLVDDLSKERSIEIECSEDAIDMRLTTLLDLYKFACYDEMDLKEIVPDNLRKFDMSVIIFEAPLKYFHTSFITKNGNKFDYKGLNVGNNTGFADVMSFKMFTLINCEIDRECLGNMIPGSMSNQQPFTMGGGTIKITYDRVYTHTMNEFMHLMLGNDGLYYNGDPGKTNDIDGDSVAARYSSDSSKYKNRYGSQAGRQIERIQAIQSSFDVNTTAAVDKHNLIYKNIVDMSEAICENSLRSLGFNALGNFADKTDPNFNFSLAMSDPNRDMTKVSATDYFELKMAMLKGGNSLDNVLSGKSTTNKFIKNWKQAYIDFKSSSIWRTPDEHNPQDHKKIGYYRTLHTYNAGSGFINDLNPNDYGTKYWLAKTQLLRDYDASDYLYNGNTIDGIDEYLVGNFSSNNGYSDMILPVKYGNTMYGETDLGPYWFAKFRALKDKFVSPEQKFELAQFKYENETPRYDYVNSRGYGNQIMPVKRGNTVYGENELGNYWLLKLRTLKDGIVNPDEMPQKYENNPHYAFDTRRYNSYSDQGYGNMTLHTDRHGNPINSRGTKYWQEKLMAMRDHHNAYNPNSGNSNMMLTTDANGWPIDTEGTKYWRRKMRQMLNDHNAYNPNSGNSNKMLTTDTNGYLMYTTGTVYWLNKMYEMQDGDNKYADNSASPTTLFTDNSGNPLKATGTNYWNQKLRDIKEGTIKPNLDWGSGSQILHTDKSGFSISSTGTQYWRHKTQMMMDGISEYSGQFMTGVSDKTLITDKFGNVVDNTNGTVYWINKMKLLKDGLDNPAITNSGSGNKMLWTDASGYPLESQGTNYWRDKLMMMKDGRSDFVYHDPNRNDPDSLNTKLQNLKNNSIGTGSLDEGSGAKTLHSDRGGYPVGSEGTNYWKDKMNEMSDKKNNFVYNDPNKNISESLETKLQNLKNNNIGSGSLDSGSGAKTLHSDRGGYPVGSDGTNYWKEKTMKMRDGHNDYVYDDPNKNISESLETKLKNLKTNSISTGDIDSGSGAKTLHSDRGGYPVGSEGTNYWKDKMSEMNDKKNNFVYNDPNKNIAESMDVKLQNLKNNNISTNNIDEGSGAKTLHSDRSGYPIESLGTKYWENKMKKLDDKEIDLGDNDLENK